ncbi:MAG: sugar phosphate isomerase/epimerase family protein [Planctomycetota bacterium]|jgi:sugar phosphate isomerase/epimerase
MNISYVISTMVFWWRENRLSFEQECEFIRSMGFGVELWPNIKGYDECRYDRRNWTRLTSATEGMLVSMRSRNDDPNLEQWSEQIECAKVLNANIVTDLRSFGIPESPDVDGCDFSAEVVKMAQENNVKLCIETGNLRKLTKIGEKFDSVYYCLDVGYANLDSEYNFKQYVDELSSRVAHLHLTDNYGQTDDHEPPGLRGGITRENWEYLLNALQKYDNELVGSLEMYPCMPAVMIRQACEFLFDELKWPNRPQKQAGYPNIVYNPT